MARRDARRYLLFWRADLYVCRSSGGVSNDGGRIKLRPYKFWFTQKRPPSKMKAALSFKDPADA